MCHHLQYRLTLCIVAITTNYRRNNNEEMWQLWWNFVAIETKSYAKPITYDATAKRAKKVHRNLRRKSVVISTSAISQNQIYDAHVVYATKIRGKLRRSCIDIAMMTLGFLIFFYIKYGITILHCNMVMPYYNVIWDYHITLEYGNAILHCNMVYNYNILIF